VLRVWADGSGLPVFVGDRGAGMSEPIASGKGWKLKGERAEDRNTHMRIVTTLVLDELKRRGLGNGKVGDAAR
jgi:hypothetical protein